MMVVDLTAAGAHRAGDDPARRARDQADRQAVAGASSSPSGRTPAGSTARSRRRSAATRWSRCSAAEREVAGALRRRERASCTEASFGAQFISGPDHAGDDVHREPQLRRHRRRRRPAGGVRGDDAGRRSGVRAVLPPVHPAAHPGGLDDERAAVRRRLGRAGVRAARRRPRSVRRRAAGDARPACAGTVEFDDVSFRYDPRAPADRAPVAGRRARPDRRHRRARPAPARRRSST